MYTFDIVIETPKGSPQKYAWDKKLRCFRLKKILPGGMIFPFDFGFIPGTEAEDSDPIDALVISEFSSFPGCMMECRLIGGILAEQEKKGKIIRNDRFFFVPILSKQFEKVKSLKDLPKAERHETGNFFTLFNKAEGKQFRIIETVEARKAWKLIREKSSGLLAAYSESVSAA